MKLPGFSAGASLGRTIEACRFHPSGLASSLRPTGAGVEQSVTPQMCVWEDNGCRYCTRRGRLTGKLYWKLIECVA